MNEIAKYCFMAYSQWIVLGKDLDEPTKCVLGDMMEDFINSANDGKDTTLQILTDYSEDWDNRISKYKKGEEE